MGKRIKLLLALVLVVPVFTFGIVAANENDDTSNTAAEQTTKDPDTTAAGIKERLEKKKAELKTKLAAAEQQRIKTKCKTAQGVVKTLGTRVKGTETSRAAVHKNSVDRLTKLAEKLKSKGVDTAQLESQIATLQTKVDTFKTDMTNYKQAVSDLASVDCTTDPAAFKAALENARSLREKLSKDVADVRAYINETIKPTLKTIRAQLEATNSDNKQEGTQ